MLWRESTHVAVYKGDFGTNLQGPSRELRATALRARLDVALIASRCENYRPRQTKKSMAATMKNRYNKYRTENGDELKSKGGG